MLFCSESDLRSHVNKFHRLVCVAEMEFVNLFQEKKNHAAFVFTRLSSFLLFWAVALPVASVSAYPSPPSVSVT